MTLFLLSSCHNKYYNFKNDLSEIIYFENNLNLNDSNFLYELRNIEDIKIDNRYKELRYIKSVGGCCAYNEFKKNAICAVHRAINLNLKMRNLTSSSDILQEINEKPPDQETKNLSYFFYVKFLNQNDTLRIKYEIVINMIKNIKSIESNNAVVCVVLGRPSYRKYVELINNINLSNNNIPINKYSQIIDKAYHILNKLFNNNFHQGLNYILSFNYNYINFEQIRFGDIFTVFSTQHTNITYDCIYLSKGFYVIYLGKNKVYILKMGQEQKLNLFINIYSLKRYLLDFNDYNYEMPYKLLEELIKKSLGIINNLY
jgi:hypothetical protein